MQQPCNYDVIIIGSGAAGLTTALQLPDHAKIAIFSKDSLSAGSTYWAQGGVAAVLDRTGDNIDQHVKDTLTAGAGLCDEAAVRHIVENGRECIEWLIGKGVPFTPDHSVNRPFDYHLTREGGHSSRRIIHSADATGRAISDTLLERAKLKPNIDLFDHHLAIDLITNSKLENCIDNNKHRCVGVYVLDLVSDQVHAFKARCTVLASGGASKTYLYTSNTDGASGDGIAMAWRVGCRVANMEFNQFHPTCLYHPNAKSFLISEAVRGEGGLLKRPDGSRFMPDYDHRAELAPRDIVARAIDHEMKRLGSDCIYLDISHKPTEFIRSHFPTIYERCISYDIDITRDPIPVVPAAHYTCGGILVDKNGQTDTKGLFAVGECSFTGLHGANRLASNSLLECFVTAKSCARIISDTIHQYPEPPSLPNWDESQVTDSDENVVISHNWDELRRFMWDYVGIVRTTKRLQRAMNRVELLQSEIHEFYSNFKVSNDLIELRNLAQVSELIIQCALARKESRGLHYTLDYPHTNNVPEDTILIPENFRA
ncbi:L-aspartate oxidase [Endozoicomonas sp. SCSIO W0465]|uniref:L-aspartate oxidase n=1 Tax=Endozoicomonas sp. SCSIO W0465 TaxID=2918516 RepID=UPI0020755D47|nr:L-aspartate oxidase [Endozoicomonas sp. SCSIO W0465]USE39059.1 L-aspartate oxidase [Endozoicomonas sp. SCSIO W0465]